MLKNIATLIENKRVDILPKALDKYIEYYKILNKEENITIISAEELNSGDKSRIQDALKKSNAGVNFTLKFDVTK
jgi:F-type H+-transporting ATPase subunit O